MGNEKEHIAFKLTEEDGGREKTTMSYKLIKSHYTSYQKVLYFFNKILMSYHHTQCQIIKIDGRS